MPNQPTIILLILCVSIFSILLFPNALYFRLNLLAVVFSTLSFIFYVGLISSLTVLMLLIVYVGAIIILIGYVCAVCPNVNFSTTTNSYSFVLVAPALVLLTPAQFLAPSLYSHSFNFFFTVVGSTIFLVVVLILFIILLIVTSYYVSPKGPFRSVS